MNIIEFVQETNSEAPGLLVWPRHVELKKVETSSIEKKNEAKQTEMDHTVLNFQNCYGLVAFTKSLE